jgi:hypothetical protein
MLRSLQGNLIPSNTQLWTVPRDPPFEGDLTGPCDSGTGAPPSPQNGNNAAATSTTPPAVEYYTIPSCLTHETSAHGVYELGMALLVGRQPAARLTGRDAGSYSLPVDCGYQVLISLFSDRSQCIDTKGWTRRRPEIASMFDYVGGSLTQNRIDVRLVQNNVQFKKPIRRSDRQLLLLPTIPGSPFNPEDLPTGTLHHMAIFAFCLGQTCHVLNLPIMPSITADPFR